MTNEERIEQAARVLARGGRLVVSRNVGAAFPSEVGRAVLPLGVNVIVCDWLPDDTVIALAPGPGLEKMAEKFPPAPARPPENGEEPHE